MMYRGPAKGPGLNTPEGAFHETCHWVVMSLGHGPQTLPVSD